LKTTTSTFDLAKSDRLYVLSSTPVSLKSGACDPISRVLGSGCTSWAIVENPVNKIEIIARETCLVFIRLIIN
jgi:hypothetical protein